MLDAGTAAPPLTRLVRLGLRCAWLGVALAVGCAAEPATGPAKTQAGGDTAQVSDASGDGAAEVANAGPDAAGDAAPNTSNDTANDTAKDAADGTAKDTALDGAADAAAADAPDAPAAPDASDAAAPGDDGDSAGDSDADPPAPTAAPAPLGPPVPAQIELLWAKQPSFAAAGQGAVVIAQAGTETVSLEVAGLPPQPLLGDPGPARALAVMPGPQVLLATTKGLYGLQGKKWGLSPVQALIGAPPQWALVQGGTGGPWLWLGQSPAPGQVAALWRHDGQLLQPVAVPDLDLSAALLQGAHWSDGPPIALGATGQPQLGGKPTPALWLVAAGALRALVTSGKAASVWPDHPLPAGKRLAGDGSGRLFWLANDGTLHLRDADGEWQWLALPEAATALAARVDLPFGAVQTAQGLWLTQQGVFFPIQGTAGLQLRGLAPNGAVIAVGKQGLLRVTPGQPTPPPPPSWAEDIEPLHSARCATCHGPAAVTVKLHTAALWQQWYPKIQKQLATDAMPLVGTKLSATDKALIKAWGAGGFAP